ncbi:unnamed protein product [Dibothriocephalus latus]|uniref:Uncharacterized protein n=1 Tax=Dibothriocephalus latus TaxID=60516 RepID=A0A3P7LYG8_DIBLA|nr:unnamed protein product [Dibothriocephalus latus]
MRRDAVRALCYLPAGKQVQGSHKSSPQKH